MTDKVEKENSGCNHYFELSQITTEATQENYVYHRVGYSVCRKCGEIRRQLV